MKRKGFPPNETAKANAVAALGQATGEFSLNSHEYLVFKDVEGYRFTVAHVGDDHYVAFVLPIQVGARSVGSDGRTYEVTEDRDIKPVD